ncbi:MAG: hypothetical protein IT178_04735 [Acidobacteria bacterium]|nr:hypothetical protein [Acidobacteriota bacterium]
MPVLAQAPATGDIGAQVTVLRLGEFDTTTVGGGVQASWPIAPWLAVDGMLSLFPGGDDDDLNIVERQRKVLGLVGLRAGHSMGQLDFYARARPGFLNFAEQDSVPCILIVPAPLSCTIGTGYTAFATELGVGARMRLTQDSRWLINVDLGDLLVRYAPEGEFRRDSDIADIRDSLLTHNLVFNIGLNWRF